MKKNIRRIAQLIIIIITVISTSCSRITPFVRQTYRSVDDRQIITLTSSNELEISEGGMNIVCKYSKERDSLRIILNASGVQQALYYQIMSQGIKAQDGTILYVPEQYQTVMKQINLQRCQAQFFDACIRGNVGAFKDLLSKGAKIESKSDIGMTPLMVAVIARRPEVVTALLALKANPNSASPAMVTALMLASGGGSWAVGEDPRLNIIQSLIASGANLNAQDANGLTALMLSVTEVNLKATQLLARSGADRSLRNHEGKSVYDYVAKDQFRSEEFKIALLTEQETKDQVAQATRLANLRKQSRNPTKTLGTFKNYCCFGRPEVTNKALVLTDVGICDKTFQGSGTTLFAEIKAAPKVEPYTHYLPDWQGFQVSIPISSETTGIVFGDTNERDVFYQALIKSLDEWRHKYEPLWNNQVIPMFTQNAINQLARQDEAWIEKSKKETGIIAAFKVASWDGSPAFKEFIISDVSVYTEGAYPLGPGKLCFADMIEPPTLGAYHQIAGNWQGFQVDFKGHGIVIFNNSNDRDAFYKSLIRAVSDWKATFQPSNLLWLDTPEYADREIQQAKVRLADTRQIVLMMRQSRVATKVLGVFKIINFGFSPPQSQMLELTDVGYRRTPPEQRDVFFANYPIEDPKSELYHDRMLAQDCYQVKYLEHSGVVFQEENKRDQFYRALMGAISDWRVKYAPIVKTKLSAIAIREMEEQLANEDTTKLSKTSVPNNQIDTHNGPSALEAKRADPKQPAITANAESQYSKLIVGKWGYIKETNLHFLADGSCFADGAYGKSPLGYYRIQGKILFTKYPNEQESGQPIISLNKDELVLERKGQPVICYKFKE